MLTTRTYTLIQSSNDLIDFTDYPFLNCEHSESCTECTQIIKFAYTDTLAYHVFQANSITVCDYNRSPSHMRYDTYVWYPRVSVSSLNFTWPSLGTSVESSGTDEHSLKQWSILVREEQAQFERNAFVLCPKFQTREIQHTLFGFFFNLLESVPWDLRRKYEIFNYIIFHWCVIYSHINTH